MGRTERPLDPHGSIVERFALQLRALRRQAGNPSYRELSARTHFSRTALSNAAAGRHLPSLPVLRAYVESCAGDVEQWQTYWRIAQAELDQFNSGGRATPAVAVTPWPVQPVVDGADPEAAGSSLDATTVHARKVPLPPRHLIGQVQLRYSAATGAVWGRFEGTTGLDHLADRRHVEIDIAVLRGDGKEVASRDVYFFDFHWSDLLRVNGHRVWAKVTVYFDGEAASTAETDRLLLGSP